MTGFDVAARPTNASAPAGATANHGHARWEKSVATLTQVQRADASSAKQPHRQCRWDEAAGAQEAHHAYIAGERATGARTRQQRRRQCEHRWQTN